jgi:hypothetical protein
MNTSNISATCTEQTNLPVIRQLISANESILCISFPPSLFEEKQTEPPRIFTYEEFHNYIESTDIDFTKFPVYLYFDTQSVLRFSFQLSTDELLRSSNRYFKFYETTMPKRTIIECYHECFPNDIQLYFDSRQNTIMTKILETNLNNTIITSNHTFLKVEIPIIALKIPTMIPLKKLLNWNRYGNYIYSICTCKITQYSSKEEIRRIQRYPLGTTCHNTFIRWLYNVLFSYLLYMHTDISTYFLRVGVEQLYNPESKTFAFNINTFFTEITDRLVWIWISAVEVGVVEDIIAIIMGYLFPKLT